MSGAEGVRVQVLQPPFAKDKLSAFHQAAHYSDMEAGEWPTTITLNAPKHATM